MITNEAKVTWLAVFLTTSFLIFTSNLATIFAFAINRHLRRNSVYCLLNLAVADSIHGFCSIFWYLWYLDWLGINFLTIKLNHSGLNIALGLINTTTLSLSLLSLLLVSLDRVYATFFPFKHRLATCGTYAKVFAFTWVLSMIVAFVPAVVREWDIYGHDVWFETLDFFCILCLVVIIVSYTSVFINIRLRNKRLAQGGLNQASVKKEKHLAMTLFIVTILSLLSWLPFIIKHEIEYSGLLFSGPVHHNLEMLAELIQLNNSLINPVVYVFRMKEFRKALFFMLFKCSRARIRIHPTRSLAQSATDIQLGRSATDGQQPGDVVLRTDHNLGT